MNYSHNNTFIYTDALIKYLDRFTCDMNEWLTWQPHFFSLMERTFIKIVPIVQKKRKKKRTHWSKNTAEELSWWKHKSVSICWCVCGPDLSCLQPSGMLHGPLCCWRFWAASPVWCSAWAPSPTAPRTGGSARAASPLSCRVMHRITEWPGGERGCSVNVSCGAVQCSKLILFISSPSKNMLLWLPFSLLYTCLGPFCNGLTSAAGL